MRENIEAFLTEFLERTQLLWATIVSDASEALAVLINWLLDRAIGTTSNDAARISQWIQPDELRDAVGYAFIAVFALVLILVLRRLRRSRSTATDTSLHASTRRPRAYGFGSIAFLVLFVGGWSALAPLASAALAPGVVSPEGSRKTVEHLEGGIIKTIHVRDGEHVTAGAPLVTLEDVQAKAQYAQLWKRYLHLIALEARLEAERDGKDRVTIPEELESLDDDEADSTMNAQLALFESGRATQMGRAEILGKRISQLQKQNEGLVDVLAAQDRQISLLEEEIEGVNKLYEEGLERRPRLLALRRAQAELEAQQASGHARIAENEQKIGETEIQLLTMRQQVIESADEEIAEVQRLLSEIRSQMPSREDILHRTVVRAPLSGIVMNVRPTTESGVIRPGEPILEIVPQETKLVVDAKVRPNDIDRVHEGMEARVLLTAYRQRNLPTIHGTLRSVSADRLIEDRTGEPYYLAKIDVNENDLAKLDALRMVPGMSAQVMLVDGQQTFFEYVVGPLVGSFNRSFLEN